MKKMTVGIVGFGKTGQFVVHEFLKDPFFEVLWVIRKSNKSTDKFASNLLGYEESFAPIFSVNEVDSTFFREQQVDIIIDFSDAAGYHIYQQAVKDGTKLVSAISKYEAADIAALQQLSTHAAVLYSPNITLGINVLLLGSKILQKIAPHADIEIIEEHFRAKNETSGTALKIAQALSLDAEKHVNSIRVGGIIGKHEVIFGLPNQTIRLIHESISKAAFGQGAIFAAKALQFKPNGMYTMEKIIADMFDSSQPVY
ncbi:MAG: 4-hydroxy-tetrahydrodipicolinate reductase [Chitinophagaceae bacterium]